MSLRQINRHFEVGSHVLAAPLNGDVRAGNGGACWGRTRGGLGDFPLSERPRKQAQSVTVVPSRPTSGGGCRWPWAMMGF